MSILRKTLLNFLILIMVISTTSSINLVNANPIEERQYQAIYELTIERSGMGSEWANWTASAILYYSNKWNVDPLLIAAKFARESNLRQWRQTKSGEWVVISSDAGAIGIAQVLRSTARERGYNNPEDPEQNIEAGIQYFAELNELYKNKGEWQLSYAEAAYNAGPGNVDNYDGIPPFTETINHLKAIGNDYQMLLKKVYG